MTVMEDKLVIAVLAGTLRERRISIHAAQYVAEFGRKYPDVEIIFVDPKDFYFPADGSDPEGKDPRYTEITARADAFFIVTPEYNHSMPGSLKRMLDSEYENYHRKAVVVAGCSNGPWGGVRVCEALLPVLHRMGMSIIQPEVYFPRVQDIFDPAGNMNQEFTGRYEKNLKNAFDELIWMARLLKQGRQQLAK